MNLFNQHPQKTRRPKSKDRRIDPALRRAVYSRDRGRCRICGQKVEWQDFHADHIIPFSASGPTTLSNLRCTHKRCNLARGTRQVREYDEVTWWHVFAILLGTVGALGLEFTLLFGR